jgi:hypothetical protein
MKNITISADENLIRRARQTARFLGKTLEEAMFEWLESYAWKNVSARKYDALMKRLRRTVRSAGPYTRDEMNKR